MNEKLKINEFVDDDEPSNPLDDFWMEGDSLAPPCQAEYDVIESILQVAQPKPSDILYDLGCGDGRICIAASSEYSCQSLGCEIEEKLIKKFRCQVEDLNLQDKVSVVHGDLLELDLTPASILVLYLLPEAIALISNRLKDAALRGTRIICNTWGPKGWTPVQRISCGYCHNVTILMFDYTSLPT